ncbi:hypothetical protein ASG29_03085 [Sphingomonas sp. Leaf412]|uniref:phosphatase PAP2 family protein n=1 Tax=Sphingomonas sp. Leaf412 TaxID=1736370 RepID=UPI0006FE3401|nr:phosphatase PAP2 family protein [Sphingomonas sp. Leaf412]KQT35120.1 hypothetical protein ASG29_03085 [Sphingomonas sp. Leaf412]
MPAAAGPSRPPRILLAAAGVSGVVGLLLFLSIATDIAPRGWDRAIMLWLRAAGGPGLRAAMIDVTALGDGVILTGVVIAAAGFLLVQRQWRTAALLVLATASGGLLAGQAKLWIARPRPELVDHLVPVTGLSFPSGHATNGAIVYLTLASLVTQVERGRGVRRYTLAVAILLVGAIGISRVYLGVHWPSDVAAGWCAGTWWALAWWWIARRVKAGRGSLQS